jgi:hypothetical protein
LLFDAADTGLDDFDVPDAWLDGGLDVDAIDEDFDSTADDFNIVLEDEFAVTFDNGSRAESEA